MKIAIVDDSKILRTAIRNTLQSSGYDIACEADGSKELFSYLGTGNKIDVMLLDVFFPDENGLDILSRVKKSHPFIKVILITGMNQKSIAEEAQRLGVNDIIYKPFGTKDLLNAIEKLKK
ncbi:CheY chemotaxis protein or a CheY-like REC (receiver) domain [Parelusimicrobium proximum]|uniref:response regulator n=1 Tax=Parelusimicrobium proximum TaxID=3228953 RepID=UPI003D1725A1